jgi:hypothetical protein
VEDLLDLRREVARVIDLCHRIADRAEELLIERRE